MSAPFTFDPTAYVAEMRKTGVTLAPFTTASGRRVFSITDPRGLPGNVLSIGQRWEAAALAHPDWMAAVHDILATEVPA